MCVCVCVCVVQLQAMAFFSESRSLDFDSDLQQVAPAVALLFMMGMLLMHKNSLAELARSRASHNSRWNLGGQYAAFLSHYKTESAADARHIKDKMVDKLGAPCFLDSDDLMVSEWLATGDSRK